MIYTETHWNTLTRSPRFQFLFEIAMLIGTAQSQNKAPRGERDWDRITTDFKSIYGRAKHLYCDVRALRDPDHTNFLKNYKLSFRTNDYGGGVIDGGVADVEKKKNSKVLGAIYKITRKDEK